MIVILGGTAEGRELSAALAERGRPAVLSLAGRTRAPLTTGETRSGGFGGVEGLVDYLRQTDAEFVVDATHPFAARISENAAEACRIAGVPLLRLSRPGWAEHPLADTWRWVTSHDEAAAFLDGLGAEPVLLTVGKQHSLDYVPRLAGRHIIARMTEAPSGPIPESWELLLARGPFALDDELELFRRLGIRALVSKDSGGAHTAAKLDAAHTVGAIVVMIGRPAAPAGVETVATVAEALAHLTPARLSACTNLRMRPDLAI
ncbi:cobalt-precorrin-6A reductase [Tessaracoccus caeni]|uniref:cobalt-precorrin-6A reductase n=1 Tax=Tessaracoccus caeni TaxID=3031239 RepID=UPI0023DC2776|nr:cobalt-precorrin-6A reductase [Tessaracoccus caeni]MDF1488977.1 cobalt-precorrin-6A reductase [Tessaracoccus caeni]